MKKNLKKALISKLTGLQPQWAKEEIFTAVVLVPGFYLKVTSC